MGVRGEMRGGLNDKLLVALALHSHKTVCMIMCLWSEKSQLVFYEYYYKHFSIISLTLVLL